MTADRPIQTNLARLPAPAFAAAMELTAGDPFQAALRASAQDDRGTLGKPAACPVGAVLCALFTYSMGKVDETWRTIKETIFAIDPDGFLDDHDHETHQMVHAWLRGMTESDRAAYAAGLADSARNAAQVAAATEATTAHA